jgi:hypothetical protein
VVSASNRFTVTLFEFVSSVLMLTPGRIGPDGAFVDCDPLWLPPLLRIDHAHVPEVLVVAVVV